MPVYTLRYVVFGTRPWHEWTEHHGAPWQRGFRSCNHGGVRSIHPRDMYMLTQLLNHVSKEQCSRGEYTKKRSPGRRKFIDGGLFGALTGAGRGIEAGARRFRGPGGPVTNTIHAQRLLLQIFPMYRQHSFWFWIPTYFQQCSVLLVYWQRQRYYNSLVH